MTTPAYPPADNEVLRMMETYGRAHQELHIGGHAVFGFFHWGVWWEITVQDGVLTTKKVKE